MIALGGGGGEPSSSRDGLEKPDFTGLERIFWYVQKKGEEVGGGRKKLERILGEKSRVGKSICRPQEGGPLMSLVGGGGRGSLYNRSFTRGIRSRSVFQGGNNKKKNKVVPTNKKRE